VPVLLFDPQLPVRYYLPPQDVRGDLLRPSRTRTFCAYEGEATYLPLEDEAGAARHAVVAALAGGVRYAQGRHVRIVVCACSTSSARCSSGVGPSRRVRSPSVMMPR
jgi:hypothetical protein